MSEAAVRKGRVGMDLTEGPVLKKLLTFAIPIMLASLVQQLYGMVDLAIIGHYVGCAGTSGVSNGGEFIDLLTPLATAFATAGQIYIGQLVGAKEHEKIKKGIYTLFAFMLIMAMICLVIAVGGFRFVLNLLNCPEEAFKQASDYMIITAFGLPFIFGYNAICGVLRGVGEARRPLIFVVVAAIVNIFADIFFVAVLHMEAAGTAIATVLSQIGSCVAAAIFMVRKREAFDLKLRITEFKLDGESLKIILKLGVPIFVKTTLIHIAMIWVNAHVNMYGIVGSSTNAIGNKLQKFVNMFTISMDSACASVIAQNLGAKKHERCKKVVYVTLGFCLCVSTVFALLSFFFPRALYGIFTKDPAVLEMGVDYLKIMIVFYYLSAIAGAFQSMITGAGFASLTFIIGIMDGIIARIGFSALFAYVFNMGIYGFFWGTALSRTIGCTISIVYFYSGKWKTRKLLAEGGRRF